MWKKQIISICCILCIGGSLAKSLRPASFDYDFREVGSRKSSTNYRGKSDTTTPRPLFQEYWQSFVRNIPTLPPIRWNMTNSLSNLFNAGAQQIMETPVGMHYQMMDEAEPNRKRKSSKRKSSTKKNKNRSRAQSRDHNSYNDYPIPTYAQSGGYQQIELQSVGMDAQNIMHFYEPKTGQYFAMQMVSGPPNYHHYNQNSNNYYNNHQEQHTYEESNDDDDAYDHDNGYGEEGYEDDEHDVHANEYDRENMDYDNVAQPESEEIEDYTDDVETADNWGYTDNEVFDDRKLKGSLNPIETLMEESIVKVQKHLLKPETEEDAMDLLSKDHQTKAKRIKPTANKETTEDKEEESARNVLGTFMKDDSINRRIQSANTKQSTRLVERPRGKYYIFPANFWLK